ncbi:hypothetical protein BMS3Bbin02_00389 [bacterium BMS3Bbin02]|nr:hypothetical protein BMS3Bbin02_00389 [bacterium BMS3Bbin02]
MMIASTAPTVGTPITTMLIPMAVTSIMRNPVTSAPGSR